MRLQATSWQIILQESPECPVKFANTFNALARVAKVCTAVLLRFWTCSKTATNLSKKVVVDLTNLSKFSPGNPKPISKVHKLCFDICTCEDGH